MGFARRVHHYSAADPQHRRALPYRNPFVVAKSGATLDLLSGGRFHPGVGVGYLKREFTALGVDFEERGALLEEALDVIRTIWTTDDVTYEGPALQRPGITAHRGHPAAPHPPIWIGGEPRRGPAPGRRVRRRLVPVPRAGHAHKTARTDVLDSNAQLAQGIDDLRRRLDAEGRDPAMVDITFSNLTGGTPGTDSFDAEAYLGGLEELAKLEGLPGRGVRARRQPRRCAGGAGPVPGSR